MPEKSIREMNKYEKLHYSLKSRTFRSIISLSIILGLVALIVGIGLYGYSLSVQITKNGYNLARNLKTIGGKVSDEVKLAELVDNIYQASFRNGTNIEKYYSKFEYVKQTDDYKMLLSVMNDFKDSSDFKHIYYVTIDERTSSIIYICDVVSERDTEIPVGYVGKIDEKLLESCLIWNGTDLLSTINKTEKYGWLSTSAYGVQNNDGEIVGFFMVDATINELISAMNSFLFQYLGAMIIVTNLLAFLMTKQINKKVVKPINSIANATQEYVIEKRIGGTNVDHFSKLDIKTGDEIEELKFTLADMEADIANIESNLTKITAEKERIGTELSLATKIQADMMPNIFPAFPDNSEFDIYATMTPAKEVGGDFYDFFLIDDTHLALVIADVSGKGVPAALFMMASKIIIHNVAMTNINPADVLEKVNSQICSNNKENMFVTVWLGILDINTGELQTASAGHEYPIFKSSSGKYELVKEKHGFVIGGMNGIKYKNNSYIIEPGSSIFIYTDGVTEATNENQVLFGNDRLLEALNKEPSEIPYKIIENVRESINNFVLSTPQFDDITMMCISYNGPKKQ